MEQKIAQRNCGGTTISSPQVPSRSFESYFAEELDASSNPLEVEGVWVQELLRIEQNERDFYNEMVRGNKTVAVDETTERVNIALNDMQKEINELPQEEKRAYERGLELHSLYIQNREFRLRFIRTAYFQPKIAALRYCRCLDFMSDLFGEFTLTRRLFITDLTEEELDYMKGGQFQILPSRDCLGRRIAVFTFSETHVNRNRKYSINSMFRVWAYMLFSIMSEDLSTQRNGMVYVGMLNTSISTTSDRYSGNMPDIRRMFEAIPLFWGSVHLCVPNEPIYRLITSLFMIWIGKEGRKLLRIHRGNRIECCYSLRNFGIPVEDMPQMQTGQCKTDNSARLMKVRMAMDTFQKEQELAMKRRRWKKGAPGTMKPFLGIECPEVDFVILGTSKAGMCHHYNHLGNIAFQKVMFANEGFKSYVKHHKESGAAYGGLDVIQRIAESITYESCLQGLHFLEYNQDKGYYTEITNTEILKKRVKEAMDKYRSKFIARSLARSARAESSGTTSPLSLSTNLSRKEFRGCA
eukprot:jgi/Psemu1/210385/e_gw1.531.4.1